MGYPIFIYYSKRLNKKLSFAKLKYSGIKCVARNHYGAVLITVCLLYLSLYKIMRSTDHDVIIKKCKNVNKNA